MTDKADKKAKAEDAQSKPRIESEAPAEQIEQPEEPRALRYTVTIEELRRMLRQD